MKIENSPFYITNNSNNVRKDLKVSSENNSELNVTQEKKIDNNENFSFWDWFRGLVNPFQNLPIISGIYSSVNSEDSKSDRDLVQNSLGGFMYGGPLGAIAGFGNWIFNKIFDKTPSEFALDATGISNLWKEDKNSEKIAHKKSDYTEKEITTGEDNQNQEVAWWKNSNQRNFSSKPSKKLVHKKELVSKDVNQVNKRVTNNYELSELSSKYLSSNKLQNNIFKGIETQKLISSKVVQIDKNKITQGTENVSKSEAELIKKENKNVKYRELNFNYPTWSSKDLEIGTIVNEKLQKNQLKRKYIDIQDNKNTGENFNMKL